MTSSPDIQIRPFREEDRPFFETILTRLIPERTASPRDPGAIARYFARRGSGEIASPDGTEVFIAVDAGDHPVGMSAIRPDKDYFDGHPRAYIELLAVTEQAEGSSVGRALMNHAERWARSRHLREIALDVFATSTGAIAFYHRLGYQPDHIRMSLSLPVDAPAADQPATVSRAETSEMGASAPTLSDSVASPRDTPPG